MLTRFSTCEQQQNHWLPVQNCALGPVGLCRWQVSILGLLPFTMPWSDWKATKAAAGSEWSSEWFVWPAVFQGMMLQAGLVVRRFSIPSSHNNSEFCLKPCLPLHCSWRELSQRLGFSYAPNQAAPERPAAGTPNKTEMFENILREVFNLYIFMLDKQSGYILYQKEHWEIDSETNWIKCVTRRDKLSGKGKIRDFWQNKLTSINVLDIFFNV